MRIAKWRERAEAYRVRAGTAAAAGEQLAFRALAECADTVADHLERGGAPLAEREAPEKAFAASA